MISNSVTTVPFGSATSVRHSLRQPFFEIAVLQKKAFSRVGAKIWSEMPNFLKTYQRRPSEKKLKGAFSDILKTEDNYIDNDKITLKNINLQLFSLYISSTYHHNYFNSFVL